jgi:hypothetical protein
MRTVDGVPPSFRNGAAAPRGVQGAARRSRRHDDSYDFRLYRLEVPVELPVEELVEGLRIEEELPVELPVEEELPELATWSSFLTLSTLLCCFTFCSIWFFSASEETEPWSVT